MNKQSALILAPHIDDELIGCSRVLVSKKLDVTVVWFHDITEERLAEGSMLAEALGFQAKVYNNWSYRDGFVKDIARDWELIYVPERGDAHQHHKQVNMQFRKIATHFYSVDQRHSVPLSARTAQLKRKLLTSFYPSQSKLLADDKYWLFEDITRKDWTTSAIFNWPAAPIQHVGVEIECDPDILDKVKTDLSLYSKLADEEMNHENLFNLFASYSLQPLSYKYRDAKTNNLMKMEFK